MSGRPYTLEEHRIFTRARTNSLLRAMLGSEDLRERWWTSPNQAFEGKTPNEVWEMDYERVYRYVLGFYEL